MLVFPSDDDDAPPQGDVDERANALTLVVLNLCDQLGRLKELMVEQGIRVPDDLGDVEPAPRDVAQELLRRMWDKKNPGRPHGDECS